MMFPKPGKKKPTAAQLYRDAMRPKRQKYKSTRTADGFPSKLEAAVYQTLLLREKAGEIKDIRRQHTVKFPCGPAWKVDFSFIEVATGDRVFCEAKGYEVEVYRLKKTMYRGCPVLENAGKLEIWKGSHSKPVLDETLVRKGKP